MGMNDDFQFHSNWVFKERLSSVKFVRGPQMVKSANWNKLLAAGSVT